MQKTEPPYFYKSSSNELFMGLLSRYSNFVPRLINLKPKYLMNPADSNALPQVGTDITDTSYDPNYIVTEIHLQQKDLTDDEVRQMTRRYSEGASVYELARDFDCHRSTIARSIKSLLELWPGLTSELKSIVRLV